LVYENGLGTFEDNTIIGNAKAGLMTKTGGSPTFNRNRINDNGYEAVWVFDGGRGTFVGNDLRNNKRGPWDIEDTCLSHVTRQDNTEA
jgi:parallel beta-helix repeat protein